MTMTFVVGADGDVFNMRIRTFVFFDGDLDFSENAVEIFFGVDFGNLVFAKAKRAVNLLHEVFFVDVVATRVAVLFPEFLRDLRQFGEVGVAGDAVSAGAVFVPNAVLDFDDDGFSLLIVSFNHFSQVRTRPDDVVVGHRPWV